jgi:hypothetical protein
MAKQSEATLLLRIKSAGEDALERTGSALATIGKVGAAAFGVVSTAVAASVHAFRESEEATNSLNQSLINQGIYSKDLADSYKNMATELQKSTTFGDDAIIAAQAQLQAYIGQNKITKELTQSILDFATAQKMDLSSAAEIVGKTIGGSTNMLARHRVEVDENATSSEKMAQVIAGLSNKFGGQAEAAAQGLGSLTQMKEAMGDMLEVVGERLAPFITMVAQGITHMAQELQNNQGILDGFVQTVQFLASVGVVAKNAIFGLAEVISQQLGSSVGAVTQVMSGNFKQAWETLKTSGSDSVDLVSSRYKTMNDELAAIDQSFQNRKQAEEESELQRVQTNEDRRTQIAQGGVITREALFAARDSKELLNLMAQEDLKNNVELNSLTRRIAQEQNYSEKVRLEYEKRKLMDDQLKDKIFQNAIKTRDFEALMNSEKVKDFSTGLSALSQLQNSKSKELVAIGKAAAIAQVGIDTSKGAMAAYAAMVGIPIVGPVLGPIAAGAVIAYGAERVANIAGVQLAEGGIVKATPGGVQATIGEGGQDEAVIPLENGRIPGSGGVQIIVYGGLLGDQSQAREFAMAVDRELLKLRQSNESYAFDSGVI